MKRIVVLICLVGLLALSIIAQTTSRPRVVAPGSPPNPTETPEPAPTADRQPPVLKGDTKTTQTTEGTVLQDDEVIKVETNLVTLPVSVLDREGRYISGLRKDEFRVYEDGVEQQIEYFASLETPFTVVLMIDVSNSTQLKIEEIQNAAIAFIDQLRKDDRVMVISFDEKVKVLTGATNNRSVLRDAVRQTTFGGGTSLYEAVSFAINQELKKVDGRKAIVLFTDGVDTTSKQSTYLTTVKEAEELDAMIYPIRFDTQGDMQAMPGQQPQSRPQTGNGVLDRVIGAIWKGNIQIGGNGGGGGNTGRGRSASEYENGKRYLLDLAEVSGGRNFDAKTISNLDAAFSGIAEELRRQYSIGYYPEKEGTTGQRKQVKVRVDQTGAVVRTKNSYIVGADASGKPKKPTPTKTATRLPF